MVAGAAPSSFGGPKVGGHAKPQAGGPQGVEGVAKILLIASGQGGGGKSTVSAHLTTLPRARLVTSRKVGQWHFFKRNDELIQAFVERLGQQL